MSISFAAVSMPAWAAKRPSSSLSCAASDLTDGMDVETVCPVADGLQRETDRSNSRSEPREKPSKSGALT